MHVNRVVSNALYLLAMVICAPGFAQSWLSNAGFELGSGEFHNPYGLTDWTGFGNQERSTEFSFDGVSSSKMFGGEGLTGLYQTIPWPPGRRIHANLRVFTPANDRIAGTSSVLLRLEYLGRRSDSVRIPVASSESPVDQWEQVDFLVPNPPGIGVGRLALVWSDGRDSTGSGYVDSLTVSQAPGTTLLQNGSFEAGSPGLGTAYGLEGWACFGNAEMSGEAAYDGTSAAKLFGGLGYSGLFQDFYYAPGCELRTSLKTFSDSSDSIGGTAKLEVKIEWPGDPIRVDDWILANEHTATGEWHEHRVSAVPPEGTVAIRVVLLLVDGDDPRGSAYTDGVEVFGVYPGDLNDDNRVDGADIEAFFRTMINPEFADEFEWAAADMCGDSIPCMPDDDVTVADVGRFVDVLLGTSRR